MLCSRSPRLKKNSSSADDVVAVERGALSAGGDRFGCRVRRRVVAELMGGELTVKRRHVLGAGGVPLAGEIGLGLGFGGAPAPVSGARLGVRRVGAGQDMREIVKGERRVLFEAQRDIAEQKIGVGIGLAVEHAVLLGNPVGEIGVAARKQAPGDDLTLVPPGVRLQRVAGIGPQDLDRGVGHVLLAAPAQLLVKEAGIGTQLHRDAGDEHVAGGRLQSERQTRLGKGAVIRRNPRQHSPRGFGLAGPQQPVEPSFVVFRANRRAVRGKKALLVERVESAGDPGGTQCRRAARDIARIQ